MNIFAPVALWGFWILLGVGWWVGELRLKTAAIFLLLWVAMLVASGFILGGMLFTPVVAVLDIALVFAIFKGDMRLN